MKTEPLKSIPPGSNPFVFDLFSMGTRINDRFVVMWGTSKNELIIVDTDTGERCKIVASIVVKPGDTAAKITKWIDLNPKS